MNRSVYAFALAAVALMGAIASAAISFAIEVAWAAVEFVWPKVEPYPALAMALPGLASVAVADPAPTRSFSARIAERPTVARQAARRSI